MQLKSLELFNLVDEDINKLLVFIPTLNSTILGRVKLQEKEIKTNDTF